VSRLRATRPSENRPCNGLAKERATATEIRSREQNCSARIPALFYDRAMSERSIYLRDQAAKCEWHPNNLSDAETQARLRKLAAEYIVEAVEIESKE
jgi:hypothetical protein